MARATCAALIWALRPLAAAGLGKAGLVFLALAGIGQVMGGAFDINHKLHGPAAMIGIPSLCIAAVLVTMAMARRSDIVAPPLWIGHLPWISFALMLGAFALFLAALTRAGVDLSGQARPPSCPPASTATSAGQTGSCSPHPTSGSCWQRWRSSGAEASLRARETRP